MGGIGQQLRQPVHLLLLQSQVSRRLQAVVLRGRMSLLLLLPELLSSRGRLDATLGRRRHRGDLRHGALPPRRRPRRRVPCPSRSSQTRHREPVYHVRRRSARNCRHRRPDLRSDVVMNISETRPFWRRWKFEISRHTTIPLPCVSFFCFLVTTTTSTTTTTTTTRLYYLST